MSCTLISHPQCLEHQMVEGHAERPERLSHLLAHLEATGLNQDLSHHTPAEASAAALAMAHPVSYIDHVRAASPAAGLIALDPDTQLGPGSLGAALRASGAVVDAVELVIHNPGTRVFCAVRPPGHHAEADAAMGFCVFNSVAVGACEALRRDGIERVAVLDFDVHHGNGTVDIFKDRPEVLVCSSFQHPFYPNRLYDLQRPNLTNTPLPAGTRSQAFRAAIERDWLPALERHKPDIILVSAGFDAHRDDPLGGLELGDDDYRWISELIVAAADRYAQGRLISTLEGGYDLNALARTAAIHIAALHA